MASFIARPTAGKFIQRNLVQQFKESLRMSNAEALFGVLQKLINILTMYPDVVSGRTSPIYDVFQIIVAEQVVIRSRLKPLDAEYLPERVIRLILGQIHQFSTNQKYQLEKWSSNHPETNQSQHSPSAPSSAAATTESVEDVYSQLKVPRDLISRQVKQKCPTCGRWGLYCTQCYIALSEHPPPLSLPFHVHVLYHPTLKVSKSTGLHAKILAPDTSSILFYPHDIPTTLDPSETVVLFPSPTSVAVSELTANNLPPPKHVIVLEGTWTSAATMSNHPRLKNLRQVHLPESYRTMFWRHQPHGSQFVSTIEAIWILAKEWFPQDSNGVQSDQTKYDSLLFYFCVEFVKMRKLYMDGGEGAELVGPLWWHNVSTAPFNTNE